MKKIFFLLPIIFFLTYVFAYAQTIEDADVYLNHQFIAGTANSDRLGYTDNQGNYHQDNPNGRAEYGNNRCDFVPSWAYLNTPYKWGGFHTPDRVDLNITNGLGLGAYRRHGQNEVQWATGIDCAGFVSRM